MEIKYVEFVQCVSVLNTLDKTKIPTDLRLTLARILRRLEPETRVFEDDRSTLVRKYGEEKNGQWNVRADLWPDFTKAQRELLNREVTVKFKPLPVAVRETLDLDVAQTAATLMLFADYESEPKVTTDSNS